RIRIGDADVPIDYELGKTEQVIATGERGGALVKFDVRRISSVNGLVRVDGKVPAYGELTVEGRTSPIGGRGEFWLEHLGAGRHPARVEFGGGICIFEIEVPAAAAAAIDLGTLSCSMAVATAR